MGRFPGPGAPAAAQPALPMSERMRAPLIPAPDLGAAPGYLEAGLWPPRPGAGDGAALNPALRIDGRVVVVADPVTGVEALFVADGPMLALLDRIAARPAEIVRLPAMLRERLTALGVLLDPAADRNARGAWQRQLGIAADRFRARGYAELPRLLSPAVLAFLRQRYRRMAREAALSYGDPQCPSRWVAHNEDAALPLHRALAPVVSAVIGEPVKPSYLYLGVYAAGSALPVHTDRDQCAFTVSLLIDYLPDLDGPSPWPLHLFLGDEPLAIHQRIGESLLFRGRDIPHARPPLFAGHMSTSIFFHFVPADFAGSIN